MKRLWPLLVAVIVGLLIAAFFRRNPLRQIEREIEAVDAAAEANRIILEKGHEKARQEVEEQYEEEIKNLDAKKKQLAEELRSNPDKLARFLVRHGGQG